MAQRFHKMHGLGNDFVILDARQSPIEIDPDRARAIADRRTGVGCDQLILLEPSDKADVKMRIWNSDGGEVEACGNAARCVALLEGGDTSIETLGGIIRGRAGAASATVDMGLPRFAWDEIPLAYPMDTSDIPIGWEDLQRPFAVNVGNPHIIFFVEDAQAVDLERLGPLIEQDPLFPEGINVNVAQLRAGGSEGAGSGGIDLRVWERGAGLTRACGTGACATAVAAIRRFDKASPVSVSLPGGELVIDWRPGEPIRMSGPAAHVFSGELAA